MSIRKHLQPHLKLVYSGGIGAYYQLHRALLGARDAGCPVELWIRKADYERIGWIYKRTLKSSGARLVFDRNLREYVSQADFSIGMLLMEPFPYTRAAMNVKIFSYLELGMPLIAYKNTEVGDFIEKWNVGWTVNPKASQVALFLKYDLGYDDYVDKKSNIDSCLASNTWISRAEVIVDNLMG